MTTPSPDQLATSIPAFTITANGSPLDSSIQVMTIEVWSGVNKLPRARLVIADGSAADEDFPVSDSAALIPGATLVIAMGYGASLVTVFSGIVHRQGLEVVRSAPPRLIVEATDKAMAMTLARANAVFTNMTDSAICSQLISTASLTPAVTSTSTQHKAVVQYYATAWDFLMLRAQANSMVVTVADGTVTVAPPDTSTTPVLASPSASRS